MHKELHPKSDVDRLYVSRNVTLADDFTLEDWRVVKVQLEVKKIIF